MRETSIIYLNQVFITNLNDHKTVLSNFNGEFKIKAKVGDVVRFTSIISERRDITITEELLKAPLNFVELKPGYHEIKEVVIRWKPTGNLRHDVLSLKNAEKKLEIAKIVGLPEPKGNGRPPEQALMGLHSGGLSFSLESIYDILSGERKKKQRLYAYEKMMKNVNTVKSYYGTAYFEKMKIPKNMIDNFLQFVYSSDNLNIFIENGNLEAVQPYMEKYLPIYQKRLRDSGLIQISQ